MKDLKSKFGTLVLLKRPIEIREAKIHLQIGRTYIEASLMTMKEFEELKNEKKLKHQHDKQMKDQKPTTPTNQDDVKKDSFQDNIDPNAMKID